MNAFLRRALSWALIALLGELVVAPAIAIAGVAPDFSVIALVMLALSSGALAGTIGGFALGLVQDLASPPLLGLNALCKTLVGYGWGRMRGQLLFGFPLVEGGVVAVAAFANDLLYLLIASGLRGEEFLAPLLLRALPAALYSGIVGIPLLRLADRLGVLARED